MGIKNLLKKLPSDDALQFQRYDFSKLEILRNKNGQADIDTMTLLVVCALRHKEAYNAGNYIPAAREFQRQVISMNLVHRWDFVLVFDGHPPKIKEHEHARQKSKDDSIRINATFIAIFIRVCKRHFVRYIVAPEEADMQVGRTRGVPVCRDADLIAYGHSTVVFVDNWSREEYRVVNMEVPATDEMRESLPLYRYYQKYGPYVIHW